MYHLRIVGVSNGLYNIFRVRQAGRSAERKRAARARTDSVLGFGMGERFEQHEVSGVTRDAIRILPQRGNGFGICCAR